MVKCYFKIAVTDLTQEILTVSGTCNPFSVATTIDTLYVMLSFNVESIPMALYKLRYTVLDATAARVEMDNGTWKTGDTA
jgi:hypothetical protein